MTGARWSLLEAIAAPLSALEEVREGASIFASDEQARGWFVDGKEIAHLHGADALELRLTRQVIREHRARLKADPRVELRGSGSDWLIVRCAGPEDLGLLLELASLAAAAHRPPDGAVSRPPPQGAALARRRRWH